MKNVLKFLTLGVILTVFAAVSVTSTLAQASLEDCDPIYQKFLADRKATDLPGMDRAIAAGNEYLEKCKATEGTEEIVPYVTKQLATIKQRREVTYDNETLYVPFDAAVKAKDSAKIIDLGKKILVKQPDYVDLFITLASVGYDEARKGVDTYNSDTLYFAKTAIQKISEGKPSTPIEGKFPNGAYGMYNYVYTTQKCADGKTNATGWMNYIIGYINYYRLKMVKDSAPFLYKASQVGCETKEIGDIYRMIGSWYGDEANKIAEKRDAMIKASITEEAPNGVESDETKSLLAMQKGYIERYIDAYVRAANAPDTSKENKEKYLNIVKASYEFLHNKDMSGYDAWISGVSGKPFPDPASTVTPVETPEPTTATTTP